MADNEIPIDERVEAVTEDMRARLDQAAAEARVDLADVQAEMRELRRELVNRALLAKDRVVEELQRTAEHLRHEVEGVEDVGAQQRAAELAAELERTATYLEDHTFEDISQNMTQVAQANIWQSLGIAFLLGLVLGLLLGGMRRR